MLAWWRRASSSGSIPDVYKDRSERRVWGIITRPDWSSKGIGRFASSFTKKADGFIVFTEKSYRVCTSFVSMTNRSAVYVDSRFNSCYLHQTFLSEAFVEWVKQKPLRFVCSWSTNILTVRKDGQGMVIRP